MGHSTQKNNTACQTLVYYVTHSLHKTLSRSKLSPFARTTSRAASVCTETHKTW